MLVTNMDTKVYVTFSRCMRAQCICVHVHMCVIVAAIFVIVHVDDGCQGSYAL